MGEPEKQSILAEEFISDFIVKKSHLSDRIEELTASPNINDELTLISNEIQKLNKTLHNSVMFLPSYSVKVRQNEIRDLEKHLKAKEDSLVPKRKFGFKSTIKSRVVDEVSQTINELTVKDEEKSICNNKTSANYCTVEDLNGVTRSYEEPKLNGNDVLLRNVMDSTIHLNGSPSTLRLKNIRNSKIICGPVQTSVFIDTCHDSTFYLCCQQLRTHSSENIDIYLRISSRAIIEDCCNIRFAPYYWKHSRSSELHAKAGIDENLERFDVVDDFNWLSAASKSPNWTTIPKNERILDF